MSYLPRPAIRVALVIVSQVARMIEARLASGALSANDSAHAMATTFRSLQGHLAAAGTTYRDVLQPNVSSTKGRTPSA